MNKNKSNEKSKRASSSAPAKSMMASSAPKQRSSQSKDTASSTSSGFGKISRVPDYIIVHIIYVLFALSFNAPQLALVAFITIYFFHRRGYKNAPAYSHYVWVLRSAIAALIVGLIFGVPGAIVGASVNEAVGAIIALPALAAAIWFIVRLVRGWLTLVDGKAIKNPKSWML